MKRSPLSRSTDRTNMGLARHGQPTHVARKHREVTRPALTLSFIHIFVPDGESRSDGVRKRAGDRGRAIGYEEISNLIGQLEPDRPGTRPAEEWAMNRRDLAGLL